VVERRLVASAGWGAIGGRVDAARHSPSPSLLDLVGHRIRQRRHRASGGDEVPVAVQQPVQLRQGERAVAPQDRDAGDPQVATADGLGCVGRRREGAAVDVRWAPTLCPRDGWVEPFPKVGERVHDRPSLLGHGDEAVVDRRQPVHEGIALGLELDPLPETHARCSAQVVGRAAAERIGRSPPGCRQVGIGHDRPPFVQGRLTGGRATERRRSRSDGPPSLLACCDSPLRLPALPRAPTSASNRRRIDADAGGCGRVEGVGRAVVVGASTGGRCAVDPASAHPDRVDALVRSRDLDVVCTSDSGHLRGTWGEGDLDLGLP
jgi:hypothetical protein